MQLIISDSTLTLAETAPRDNQLIDPSGLRIANRAGCFACWAKTPGKYVIRDDTVKVYPCITASDKRMCVNKIRCGGYDTAMKPMPERAIPVQQALIRLHHGEVRRLQRNVASKQEIVGEFR